MRYDWDDSSAREWLDAAQLDNKKVKILLKMKKITATRCLSVSVPAYSISVCLSLSVHISLCIFLCLSVSLYPSNHALVQYQQYLYRWCTSTDWLTLYMPNTNYLYNFVHRPVVEPPYQKQLLESDTSFVCIILFTLLSLTKQCILFVP